MQKSSVPCPLDSDPAKAMRDLEDAMSALRATLRQLDPQLAVEFSNASICVYGALELVRDLLPRPELAVVTDLHPASVPRTAISS